MESITDDSNAESITTYMGVIAYKNSNTVLLPIRLIIRPMRRYKLNTLFRPTDEEAYN